jgi:hypothetical protein
MRKSTAPPGPPPQDMSMSMSMSMTQAQAQAQAQSHPGTPHTHRSSAVTHALAPHHKAGRVKVSSYLI